MPRAKSFEEEIAYYQAKKDRTLRAVADAFGQSAGVHALWGGKHPREEMWILSEDTHPVDPGKARPWRISKFGKDGPYGHDVGADRAAAVVLAADGDPTDVVPMTDAEVIEWTSTPQYQEGVKHVAFMQAVNTVSWLAAKHPANEDELRDAYDRGWKMAHDGKIEEATALLERALRAGATPNPAPRFTPNPAWVTKVIADNWDKIATEMGPNYLPKFGQVRANRNRISATMKELGCGAFGCVLPVEADPTVVLKITTDQSEMDFVVKILPELPALITTKYFAWKWTKSTRRARRVGLLWRESADFVGEIHKNIPDGLEALKAIRSQHEAASQCLLSVLRDQYGALPGLLAAWQALADRMARIPELAFVGRGMLAAYEQQGVFFADVHEGNLGRVMRDGRYQWVITDPGNVIVIGDEAAEDYEPEVDAGELEDLRRIFNVNPAGEMFVCMDRDLKEFGRAQSVQGAMDTAPPGNRYAIVRGEYTSDGTHWGLGRGRQVAVREMGPSGFRWYRG